MLIFSKIRFKNILSFGNQLTTFEFNNNNCILIQGNNGAGKSAALLDTFSFGLFGKPFRKINKPHLVNNKNKKDLLVEIWFTDEKNNQYYVKRGINPQIFEVYQNDILLNQDSRLIDYQYNFENNILKMTYQSFTQLVILGKATFVSFLRLKLNERREFIENILNLTIFSLMNEKTKQYISDIKNDITENKSNLTLIKQQINLVSNNIKDYKKQLLKQEIEYKKLIEEKIDKLKNEISEIEDEIKNQKSKLVSVDDAYFDKLSNKLDECLTYKYHINSKINDLNKKISFFNSNKICPTCENDIDDKIKNEKEEKFIKEKDKLESSMILLENKIKEVNDKLTNLKEVVNQNNTIYNNINLLNNNIKEKMKIIVEYENNKDLSIDSNNNLEKYELSLKELKNKQELEENKKEALFNKYECYNFISSMLKDSGIKTVIIKRYIPFIIQTMNKYLRELGLFVNFQLNENFEETLIHRGIDVLSYNNFSEGEKLRIDLAMLLTWRDVAKKQNNLSINFLIFDEILDSSADNYAIESLFSIFKELKNRNIKIFVVSHSNFWQDKFDSIWKIKKENGFSSIIKLVN